MVRFELARAASRRPTRFGKLSAVARDRRSSSCADPIDSWIENAVPGWHRSTSKAAKSAFGSAAANSPTRFGPRSAQPSGSSVRVALPQRCGCVPPMACQRSIRLEACKDQSASRNPCRNGPLWPYGNPRAARRAAFAACPIDSPTGSSRRVNRARCEIPAPRECLLLRRRCPSLIHSLGH